MKHLFKILFALSILITNHTKAEGLNDIKKDSIVSIPNSDLSLIYYKKTTAVWHNFANFYVVEPTKNWFVYLHSAQLLVEVDFKHKTFYAVVEDELTGGYKRFLIGKKSFKAELTDIRKGCVQKETAFKIDSVFFDLSFNKLGQNKHIIKSNGEIGFEFNKTNVIITDYQIERSYSDIIMSLEYPGEDSINSDGQVCYKEYGFDYTISKSGIFNIKKKNWLLPRKFNTIHYTKSEFITNPAPTNLKEQNSQIWRKKFCKWELKSPSYSSIEKIGNIYICTTQLDEYGQFSYLILDKKLKPISVNDFYNFDAVESTNKGVKITPVLSNSTSIFELDFNGNLLNSDIQK